MKKQAIYILITFLLIPAAFSMQGKMPLLAVRETETGYSGSTAELQLEVNDGSGRVFVDTFPLSKIDTQISMRFAKEIACDYLETDCSRYDFIYTIRANSPIIGGPSAGAAATVLTVAVLTGTDLDKTTAMTGTINSGALIGPVGGLKEKIRAGASSGLKKIIIPEGESELMNETGFNATNSSVNETLDLIEFGKINGVKVINVSDLDSALLEFTGKKFRKNAEIISISPIYNQTMRLLAKQLCDRNVELKSMVTVGNSNETLTKYNDAINYSDKGQKAFESKEFYAAASYCFGSNVKLNEIFLDSKNFSSKKYEGLFDSLRQNISALDKDLGSRKIKTITDLESYMVVKERLDEALSFTNISTNSSSASNYAYALERTLSAYAWSEFYKNLGKEMAFDDSSLRDSCSKKIAETEERFQYLSLYFPFPLTTAKKDLDSAYGNYNRGHFALCLFDASKAKAEVNVVLNTLGIEQDYLPRLIDNQLSAARMQIVKQSSKNIFPILGYSYYEYANNLKSTDTYSALLYSEYALEFSNLDLYFNEKVSTRQKTNFHIGIRNTVIILISFAIGILIGFISALAFYGASKKKKAKK